MANEKKLSPEQAAINAALVAQYDKPAKVIGKNADAIEKAKGDTWGAFKDAARIGWAASQDVATMSKGITLACAHYSVPQGSVNAYLPILRKLYKEGAAMNADDREALLTISIGDARKKWQPKKEKAQPAKPETGKAEGAANAAEAGDGTSGDDNGMMGGTRRSRLLSIANEWLAAMSDADLLDFVLQCDPDYLNGQSREEFLAEAA